MPLTAESRHRIKAESITAWVETVYHRRVHSETGQPPLTRFLAGGPPPPVPADRLAEAFRWGEWRTVNSTATVSLHGNRYQVDPALAGARVELVFDPHDLTDIAVRHHGRPVGAATPFHISRHVHPKARTDPAPPPTPTGIDYLRLVDDRHTRELETRLHYATLDDPPNPAPAHPQPAGPEPAGQPSPPPPDPDGHHYPTDLIGLADTEQADTEQEDNQ